MSCKGVVLATPTWNWTHNPRIKRNCMVVFEGFCNVSHFLSLRRGGHLSHITLPWILISLRLVFLWSTQSVRQFAYHSAPFLQTHPHIDHRCRWRYQKKVQCLHIHLMFLGQTECYGVLLSWWNWNPLAWPLGPNPSEVYHYPLVMTNIDMV